MLKSSLNKLLILISISFSINCQENIKEKSNINLDQVYLDLKNKIDNNQEIEPICHAIKANLSHTQIEIIRNKLITEYKNTLESIVKPGLETGILMPLRTKIDLEEKSAQKTLYCSAAQFSPNNNYLILGFTNGKIILFNTQDLSLKRFLETVDISRINALIFSNNNKYAISASYTNVYIHDVESKNQEPLSTIQTKSSTSLALNPNNNNILIIGCYIGQIEIWNIEHTNAPQKILDMNLLEEIPKNLSSFNKSTFDYMNAARIINFSKDGQFLLIVCHKSYLLQNINDKSYEKVKTFDFSGIAYFSTIAYFIPQSNYILCRNDDSYHNQFELFNLSNLDKQQSINFDQKINLSACFTADGNYALLTSPGQTHQYIYNIKNIFNTKRIMSIQEELGFQCLSPNGQYWLKTDASGEKVYLNNFSWPINRLNLRQILLLIQLAKLSIYNNELNNPDLKKVFQQFNPGFQNLLRNYLIKKNLGQFIVVADIINLIEEYRFEEDKIQEIITASVPRKIENKSKTNSRCVIS